MLTSFKQGGAHRMTDRTDDQEQGEGGIRAVTRVCALLTVLQSSPGGVLLPAAVAATGMPKSSVYRYLTQLVEEGYAERDPEAGTYHAGRALFAPYGSRVERITLHARPLLTALATKLGETVMLGYLDGTRVMYLDIAESPRTVRSGPRQWDRDPVHATAVGKAIASRLDPESLQAVLDTEGMPALTPRTITDREILIAELDMTRRRGCAWEDREYSADARGVAVPLPLVPRRLAVGMSAPSGRLAPSAVLGVAERLADVAHRIGRGASATP